MCLDLGVEFFDEVRSFGGEVFGFTDVVGDVKKAVAVGSVFALVEFADEFPVFVVDGDGGWDPVGDGGHVGEVGEDAVASEGFSLEGGEDVESVEDLVFFFFERKNFEESGVEIGGLN